MITQKLIDVANNYLLKGKTVTETKQQLINEGWPAQDVEEAFLAYPQDQAAGKADKGRKIKIISIAAGIILLLGVGLFFWLQDSNILKTELPAPSNSIEEKVTTPKEELKQAAEEPVKTSQTDEVPVKKLPKLPSAITVSSEEFTPLLNSIKQETYLQKTSSFTANETVIAPGLKLTMEVPKNIYAVGENFEGRVALANLEKEPYKILTLALIGREGFPDEKISTSVRSISPNDNSGEMLEAFNLSGNGFTSSRSSFSEAGNYTFTIIIYKCSDLYSNEDECTYEIKDDYLKDFKPLASISKTISVVE